MMRLDMCGDMTRLLPRMPADTITTKTLVACQGMLPFHAPSKLWVTRTGLPVSRAPWGRVEIGCIFPKQTSFG